MTEVAQRKAASSESFPHAGARSGRLRTVPAAGADSGRERNLVPARPAERGSSRMAENLGLLRPFLEREGVFLHIGTGTALLARAVAERVRYAYGVELGTAPHTGDEGPSNFMLLPAGRAHLPLGDCRVSVAFSDRLAEQLAPAEFARHLREVCRVLVPGGAYVFRTSGAQPSGELVERFRAAGFAAVGLRARVAGWSFPVPGWASGLTETTLLRPLFDAATVVAWKDTRGLAHAMMPAALHAGVA